MVPWSVAGAIALLGGCMFFSLSESSIFSMQGIDRENIKEDPRVGDLLTHLLRQPRRLLAALLIGMELSNVGLSTVSASLLLTYVPEYPWLNVVVVAPILILFGDVLPQSIGIRFSRSVARVILRPLSIWNELVSPIRFVLGGIVDSILRVFGVHPPDDAATVREEQIRVLIDQGRAAGAIQPIEQEIIHRVFEFGDLPTARLMTPRPDIFSLSITTPWPELLQQVKEARYSRVPIWQGAPDNVIGILLVKELLRVRSGPPPNARQLQRVLHPAMFVPPSKPAKDLLREFRAKMQHLALVVDEHGSVTGLVTLDDLLTELVGELHDESDADEREISQIQPDRWVVRAGMDIEDFTQSFDMDVPEGDWTTVGGFVFHLLGRAPVKGDEVTWNDLAFHVTGVEGRRITEVMVVRRLAEPDATTEEKR